MPIGAAIPDPAAVLEVGNKFVPLYEFLDYRARAERDRPLLAHYTSLEAFEKIIATSELWFSNPLFMNDLEEVRFGALQGASIFMNSDIVGDAAGSPARYETLKNAFRHFYQQFDTQGAIDVFVFCLSEHPKENTDGLLSMWRGYGGQGHGVALVFDTSRLQFVETAPMFILKVDYASSQNRVQRLNEMISRWAAIVKQGQIADGLLHVAAFAAFRATILLGLTQKHDGFSEEREWRVVYLRDLDAQGLLRQMLSYDIGKQGVEPKLKFKLETGSAGDWPKQGMDELLQKIILEPSVSSHLAKLAVERMLQTLGKQQFVERVVASTIPLRPSHPGR